MRRFDLPGRSPVIAENGMAATSHPLATQSAIDILKRGGNAVDAALAASATLCVVEPHMTGIGGDCFVILEEPDGSLHALDGAGRAAMEADAALCRERNGDRPVLEGALSVTVPGAVKAWEALSQRFGTMGFDMLFVDAIRYGEEGYPIHARVGAGWAELVAELAADEGAARHALVDGRAPAIGSRHSWPALAGTLRKIAAGGSSAFYKGEIAAEIVATVRAKGGFLSEADLAAVTADWVKPVSATYRGHEVFELPPSGQGITALILLRLLDRLGASGMAADGAERRHLEAEAGRIAYAVRDHLVGDPDHMTRSVEDLLSDAHVEALAALYDPRRRNTNLVLPRHPAASTVYLTVVDRDRRAVSFINSLYDAFGARIATPRSGIMLQNRGACFSLVEGHPNEIGPGKRPLHTIIPALVRQGPRAAISFGVMGGSYQAMGHAHVLSNLIDHGLDPQEAVDSPRIFWAEDGALTVESGIGDELIGGLEARGHEVRRSPRPIGGAQMIVIDRRNGFLIGASDPRKDGQAAGW